MACLTDNQLGALVEGALPDSAPAWAHLSECSSCARLVSSLAEHAFPPAARAGPEPVSLEGHRWAGRYEVLRRLGSGRRSVTFEALDVADGERVALQLLWGTRAGDWAAQASRFLGWRHPSACGVRAIGVVDAQPWLVSDLIAGAQSLRGRVVPWAAAWPLFRDVAGALEAAHDAGLVHGAVSPGCVLVRDDGRAVLGDFAVSHAPPPAPDQRVISARAEALGAVGDQRAFCLALWECLAGSRRAPLAPAAPTAVVEALEHGLESGFPSIRALREALAS